MLKYASRYNYYGVRYALINDDMIEENCLRCNEIEMWKYVIKCTDTKKMRKEFVTELLKEIIENKDREVEIEEIFEMIKDILRYLDDKEEEEYKTNQVIIGMQQLFRGYVIKVWKGVNFNQEKYHSLNKILEKHCILYYIKCWKYRNEIYHNVEA